MHAIQATEIKLRQRSRSKPDRGIVNTLLEVLNADGEVVLSMKPMNLVRTRHPEAPE